MKSTVAKKRIMHVISGTHWDREWRFTAEQSKLKLADLVDSMLEILEKDPEWKSFTLDGGTIVVEDYLDVRPENRERILKLIKNGRVCLVGWYTLPDSFIVAPESLVRNMLLGRKMAREYGGAMKSGYTAFSYGQTSQLPQMYRGFGVETALFYRGTNKFEMPPLYIWEGKDGSRLHAVRTFDDVTRTNWFFYPHYRLLCNKNYRDARYYYDPAERPMHFCDEPLYERAILKLKEDPNFKNDEESLRGAVDAILKQAEPHAIGRHLLALNVQDNEWCYKPLPKMIAAMNKLSPDVEIVQSTFDEYFKALLSEHGSDELKVKHGELRYTGVAPGLNGLYGEPQSSRIKLKILNDESETWLINQAEPFASLSAMAGGEYPRAMLDRAWKLLLSNHGHDSICGAAVDQAHEDMLYRFSACTQVAQEVAARSVTSLFSKLDTKSVFKDDQFVISVFNPTLFARKEVIPVVVDLPATDKEPSPVDPCTGKTRYDKEIKHFDIVGTDGTKLNFEVLSRETIWKGVESTLDSLSIEQRTIRRRMLLEVNVPPMGCATFALRQRQPKLIEHPVPALDRALIGRPDATLENEHIRVRINSNGTFSILNKATGRMFENLHYFTDSGETGSAHRSNAPQRNRVITSHGCAAEISMEETSLLRGVYRIEFRLRIPALASADARERMREERELPIVTWLTLEKGSRILKIRTKIVNAARDHKLQFHLSTGLKTNEVAVESAFAVEKRDVRWMDTADNSESRFMTQPMQNFVDVSDGKDGLAVITAGLREYETHDDASRTLSITLLRTQRAYMKANANMTSEELDRYPGGHMIGEQEFKYALYAHEGDWASGKVLEQAYRFKVSLRAVLGVPADGDIPANGSLLTVKPAGRIMLACLKQAESGKGYVVRLWNASGQKIVMEISSAFSVKGASRLRMDEKPEEKLEKGREGHSLPVSPYKIETVLLNV